MARTRSGAREEAAGVLSCPNCNRDITIFRGAGGTASSMRTLTTGRQTCRGVSIGPWRTATPSSGGREGSTIRGPVLGTPPASIISAVGNAPLTKRAEKTPISPRATTTLAGSTTQATTRPTPYPKTPATTNFPSYPPQPTRDRPQTPSRITIKRPKPMLKPSLRSKSSWTS